MGRMAKRKGKHPHRALNQGLVKSLRVAGRYADGNGLHLVVDRNGSKRWILRTVIRSARTDLGLGSTRLVSLAEARSRASEARAIARAGQDPRLAKRKTLSTPTFAEAAMMVFELNKPTWKNRKHVGQWLSTLNTYAFPVLGRLPIDQIDTPDILKVLAPIWVDKHETAQRVRQRMKVVLDWARTSGFRSGDNPALAVTSGLPTLKRTKKHQTALPFQKVAAFLRALRESQNCHSVKLGLEFLILTSTRTNEVLQMKWSEIEGSLWTLPAERTKSNRTFRIPLPIRAVEILTAAKALHTASPYVFPSPAGTDTPLSNMALLMAIRRLGLDVTAHGFRSSFSDWAHETTRFENIVIEMALNHSVKSKAEKAYRRGDLLEKRKELMEAWSIYVSRTDAQSEASHL